MLLSLCIYRNETSSHSLFLHPLPSLRCIHSKKSACNLLRTVSEQWVPPPLCFTSSLAEMSAISLLHATLAYCMRTQEGMRGVQNWQQLSSHWITSAVLSQTTSLSRSSVPDEVISNEVARLSLYGIQQLHTAQTPCAHFCCCLQWGWRRPSMIGSEMWNFKGRKNLEH